MWKQLVERAYPEHTTIYADGSKTKNGVAAAAICLERKLAVSVVMDKRVPISAAEIQAIKMAIRMAIREESKNTLICSDSQSTLEGLERTGSPKNDTIRTMEIRQSVIEAKDIGINVVMIWTFAHKGIKDIEEADELAKPAPDDKSLQYRIEGLETEHCNKTFKTKLSNKACEDMTKYPKSREYFLHIKKFSFKPWFHGLGLTLKIR